MPKHYALLALSLCCTTSLLAQTGDWEPAGDRIRTEWANEVDPGAPLPEYPRPQLVRENWQNLNGLWDYAIEPKGDTKPTTYTGKILVPFAVESSLSGVGDTVGEDNYLWYRLNFTPEEVENGARTLLHFGAVDWESEVFVNGNSVGTHRGGFDPFSYDITERLSDGGEQELVVRVWDPSDRGPQPRGKQVKEPEGIYYTPVTGIWQTVWLESVPAAYVASTKNTPDLDAETVTVAASVEGAERGDEVRVKLLDGDETVAEQTAPPGTPVELAVGSPRAWSPEDPHLYDLEVSVLRNGEVIDRVRSYTALREIALEPNAEGIQIMTLNNEPYFQYGPLDQGWWPDGLYTAPTDEALLFDIVKTKEMGFNMIRKHVKVEPARWYRYCDSIGLLVWQDMPSGDQGNQWSGRPGVIGRKGLERERTPESERIFRTEWAAIMDATYNFPSIVVWVPFNEAWGQFKTEEITEWTMGYDSTRLVNSASGGNFVNTGDIIDVHNYPDPEMPDPELFGETRALVLGEFGGIGLPEDGHTWQNKDNWGYVSYGSKQEVLDRYGEMVDSIEELIPLGLSAAVYTQTTDVEGEVNGTMTYDRKVIKLDAAKLNALHASLYTVNAK